MAAQLISVTSFQALNNVDGPATTSSVIVINPARIIAVKTRASAYRTDGITDIVYELPVNQKKYQVILIVEESAAEIITAANANVVAA